MNNILIFGGTGAMGEHLVNILSENKDNQVYVTTRKKRESKSENVLYVEGDAKDNVFLSSILNRKKWDCIVDFMIYNTDEFKNRAYKLLESTGQYVFLSSSRVYADSDTAITENSPRLLDVCTDKEYLSTDEYALTKARQENFLFGSKHKNWTIIRPYITYSEQRLQLGVLEKEEWLYVALNGNTIIFSDDIASKTTTLTYGGDVANGIASLIGKNESFADSFHITSENPIQWKTVMDIYIGILEKNGITPSIIMEKECYRTHNLRPAYQVIYDRYFNRTFDNTKISHFVDVSTFKKTSEGLSECLSKFLLHPEFRCMLYENAVSVHNVRIPLSRLNDNKNRAKYLLMRLGLYKALKSICHK